MGVVGSQERAIARLPTTRGRNLTRLLAKVDSNGDVGGVEAVVRNGVVSPRRLGMGSRQR
jgi:hypothetical protein